MEPIVANINEQQAESAFSTQSVIFDELYSGNTIINYKRKRVRDHILQFLKPGSSILELNSGTGEDALFFAQKGFKVHATDISVGMQAELKRKVASAGLNENVTTEICSYTMLDQLRNNGPFDHIFSNFAGLNCTNELDKVLGSFDSLLKPGGTVTLVVLPKFCLWETLMLFKGKFRTAFRRFFSGNGVKAHIEGVYFKCWYYQPSFIIKRLKDQFDLMGVEGLCAIVPPSYIEGFAEKHPALYKFLVDNEDKLKSSCPWKFIGDYYIISLKRK
ncbi:class I SAM-dependent methyltransferase [Mucilaginibacter sp. BJC16-A38]|uniref:class I SAM-dependent methyltransferase n=1 Tax=Mucilaginibacter phenanthrenivorans TaxID=1234842 RepID=UPI002157677E|nr:class I SAM-dependent methyltransferase [Mucilaginibacter phenanthrenivorans]MCR8559983.1 class I SAM-dependent methyltransferase [Mucilaginibacter phenanthrenivorans]